MKKLADLTHNQRMLLRIWVDLAHQYPPSKAEDFPHEYISAVAELSKERGVPRTPHRRHDDFISAPQHLGLGQRHTIRAHPAYGAKG